MREERLLYCPRCRSRPRPKGEWSIHPSHGYMVCGTCRWAGWNGDLEWVEPAPRTDKVTDNPPGP